MKNRARTSGPKRAVNDKVKEMIAEGYRPDVAVAAAHSMQRRGTLGPRGGYERTHRTKRGPVGRMRRDDQ